MKNPIRALCITAALFLSTISSHSFAASQVTMDLTGKVITSGSTILVTSTTPIDHAQIYFYSISGTVVGTHDFVALTGTVGIDLDAALSLTDSALVPYLNGTVLDASGKFPFTAVNKLAKGKYTVPSGPLSGDSLTGTVRGKAGISNKGIAYGELTNIAYTVKVPVFGNIKVPKDDTLVFTSGQVIVGTSPITSGSSQPDLSYLTPTGLVGVGITGTGNVGVGGSETVPTVDLKKGKSTTVAMSLQNSGTASDTFALTATPTNSGFTQKFLINGKDETALVTGTTGGFTTVAIPSGAVKTFVWKVTNKSAATANTDAPVLTAKSLSDPTKADSVSISVQAE